MTRENLEKLRDLQTDLGNKKALLALKKTEFLFTVNDTVESIEKIESHIELYKKGIEIEAISEFKATGNKQLLGGVKVQEKKIKTIEYKPADALKWAKEKDMFLMYDKKAFEKAVDSLPEMSWLKIKTSTENKVTFPKEIKLED